MNGKKSGPQSPSSFSTNVHWIATLAEDYPTGPVVNLSQVMDMDWFREAFRRTRKDGAAGVDGITGEQYTVHLEDNLGSLMHRIRSGTYRAPPVRRTYIEKDGGKSQRPLGIPTFEDKVAQRAVAMVLTPIFERMFLDCSWGYRPGRSAHGALSALQEAAFQLGTGQGWVIDLDVQKFFDKLNHQWLREFFCKRIRDKTIVRMIGRWLKAGVMEDGLWSASEAGTPQGGVISPLLANIYLHEVLDTWFEKEVRPRLRGKSHMSRYADDAVILLENKEDAERVLAVLHKRFAKHGLQLHPEKTKLVDFQRPYFGSTRKLHRPETFDFLGFNIHWEKTRTGGWIPKLKTAKSRVKRALVRVSEWCRKNRHRRVRDQHKTLSAKLRGHCEYFGVRGNSAGVGRVVEGAKAIWFKWLARRSGKRTFSWEAFRLLCARYPLKSHMRQVPA
jgi:RNA-directed DNA polymerase